jgi:Mn2+/Fe2+ NRAMP family transporter
LKWLTLPLFAFGTVFVVHINWKEAIQGTFIPNVSLKREYLAALIAVLGTTISPYLLFWQSEEEVEQMESAPGEEALKKTPTKRRNNFGESRSIPLPTSEWQSPTSSPNFIILTTAVTLHANGKTDIDSAEQAAEALRPIAGVFASLLFSLGVVGTGLLALPVLGSAAYAVGEALRWPVGLERKAKEAKAFYSVWRLQR